MGSRVGITRCSTGNVSSARAATGSFSRSRRVIRASPKWKRRNYSSEPAAITSPSCTRTNMIRSFLLLSLLFTTAIVAIFGFRGQKSTASPLEVFPDMVRQMKVRAQAPSNFFGDGRGPRLPSAAAVPLRYEMPQPQTIATPAAAVEVPATHPRLAFSVGTDYYDTGKMGDHWGTGI